jgi:hypothetical protein
VADESTTTSLPATNGVEAGEDVFATRMPCVRCGYDLKSIALSGRCPECGGPCVESLGSMYAADAGEVSGMVAGLRMMMWAAIALPALGGALFYLDIRRDTSGPEFTLFGLAGAGIAGPWLAWSGLRRVSGEVHPSSGAVALRPDAILSDAPAARAMAAMYAVFSTLAALCLIGLMLSSRSGPGPGNGWAWLMGTLGVLTGVAWTVRNALFSARGANMAALSNRPGMRRVFQAMGWISVGGTVAVLGYGLVGVLAFVYKNDLLYGLTSGRRSNAMAMVLMAGQVIGSVVNLCALGWLVLWPVMLGVLAKHLRGVGLAMTAAGGVVIARVAVERDDSRVGAVAK